jgi:hypothetical protein
VRFLVGVHRDHDFSGDVIAIEHARDFLARLSFQADKAIDLVALFADNLGCGVEGDARVALDIDDARDLDLRSLSQGVFVSAQAILQVRLVGHGEDHDVPFALEFLRQALATCKSSLIVIGPDEKQALARRRIGVDRDDGHASRDRLINAVLE